MAQLQETPAWTGTEQALDRITNSRPMRALRKWSKLERFLAGLCLFIPVLLIAYDAWSIRGSISAYFSMEENQIFYVPLTVAAMLFLVNGVIKEKHAYNTALGLMLTGVILFDHVEVPITHGIFAGAFFVGNALVIVLFSTGTSKQLRWGFIAGIVAAAAAFAIFDGFTLFWAEWASFAIIGIHYILDSIDNDKYSAVEKHTKRAPATG